jgi:hypothetical protein
LNKFRVQSVGVLALVLLVGWPRFAPLPTLTVWRNGASGLAPQPGALTADERLQAAEDLAARRGGAGRPGSAARSREENARRLAAGGSGGFDGLPEGLRETGAKINAIVGRARTVTGDPVRYARLLLRNTSTGLIEARATADQEGRFTFLDVIPSGYVVELVGLDGSIIAASELVSIENGVLRQATIRVAANSTVRAIFGGIVTSPTVQETVNRAADTGTRTIVPPAATNSPQL